jgi:hypothetical protein
MSCRRCCGRQTWYTASLSFLRACCYIQIHYQLMHIIKNIHSLHFKKLHIKMSVIHIKIKIKNPTFFGHSYSTIIRGSQCLCILLLPMCVQYLIRVRGCVLPVCLYMRCACPYGVCSCTVHEQTLYGQAHRIYTQVTQSHVRV